MTHAIDERVRGLPPEFFRGARRGIEKEGLRVRPDGALACTPHPPALGSPLTHPRITTDFSESQLELVTGVHDDVGSCLAELEDLHQEVHARIGDELLWGASMPCPLPPEDGIPIARYGESNAGRLKVLYREGLARRYGRRMQVISGIHYNFSLSEAAWRILLESEDAPRGAGDRRDGRYLDLIRNIRRHAWLAVLLLGSSPAACASFAQGREADLSSWDAGTVFGPAATSLRMGRLGYRSPAQSALAVSFNDLPGYARALDAALRRPWPAYEAIGLGEGESRRQLSTGLLQIENEFYTSIRPKCTPRKAERPLEALGARGIEYVEVRCIDIDPFAPVGIGDRAFRLLDVLLFHGLLRDSPPDTPAEIAASARNDRAIAEAGRDPATRLERDGQAVSPADWGRELLREFEPVARALDHAGGGGAHARALDWAARALRDPGMLPSARVLREVEAEHARSFADFALDRSRRHRESLAQRPRPEGSAARFAEAAARSHAERRRQEETDDLPFEEFLRRFLDRDLLAGPRFAAGRAA